MIENNDKKNNSYYFQLFTGVGIIFGVIFNQIPIGLFLGGAIGLTLDYKKKK